MSLTVLKWNNRIVRLVKYQRKVLFSDNEDWLLLQYPLDLPENKRRLLWVPLSTRFEWKREFN
jgi:predicted amidophosphoribosyltransferase